MPEATLKINCKADREGKALLTVRIGDDVIACERVDLFDPKAREDLADRITAGRKGIKAKDVLYEIDKAAAIVGGAGPDDSEDKEPQAAALVRLAEDDELFRDPSGEMALAAVTVGKGEDRRTEIHPIGSKGYRTSLARRFYQKTKRPPNAQAMQDAIQILTGEAIFEGPTRPTAVRVAMHEGAQYIDLADDRRRVIRITPSGAAILDSQIPVAFLRKRGMQALPCPDLSAEPEALDELRALINASNDQHWRLMLAYLIASLRPVGPYVILGVNGEQGSAKSTACRLIRRSIDPNESDLRGSPRDERDLIIAAMNSWICGYDNLSSISLQMSDALCRVSTGAGFATRELFTDEGEKIFAVCRPQLLNGIGDVLDQSDLLDRAIIVTLDRISDERRRTEADIWREFERIRPRVFGALINATSLAMKRENEITLAWAPRMIDAARWIAAAEPALPVPAGSLLEAYRQNRAEAAEIALEASAVAAGVIELVNRRIGFDGSVGELLNVLNEICDLNLKRRPDWPRNPKGLGNKLRRVAPVLRRHGIEVSDRGRGKHGYQITICGTSPNRNSSCSPSSPDPLALSKENEDGEHGELLPSKCITESPRRKQVEV